MPSLREVQTALGQAILGVDAAIVAGMVHGDGLDPLARVAIHRNQFVESLTAALKTTYPVLCQLVHERFFDRLAHAYVSAHPPTQPCLSEYGADLAAFVAQFPGCVTLPYLRDVAAFEWTVNQVRNASPAASVSPAVLASAAADPACVVQLTLAPRLRVMHSRWPVDRIWRAHQPGVEGDAAIDLDSGTAHLEISSDEQALTIQRIDAPTFVCLDALINGSTLQSATEAALSVDPLFDLLSVLLGLLSKGFITNVRVFPSPQGE